MTYSQAICYLESFINYEKIASYPYKSSLKLERFRDYLSRIGNPQRHLRCINVAGTKGKGSTCAFIAYILNRSGFKAGLYTSPHLSDFRERIRILPVPLQNKRVDTFAASTPPGINLQANRRIDFEGMISKRELSGLISSLRPSIDKYNKKSRLGALSFFEVYTAVAFCYFKDKKVDFAVLETGLGGRLDATNTVEPLVSVITSISYEHTQKLGNTLAQIAAEKAGIIKAVQGGLPVISAPQVKEVLAVIKKKCVDVNASLFSVGKDIKFRQIKSRAEIKGLLGTYKGIKLNLSGRHQLINAASAVGAVESLKLRGFKIPPESIKSGLKNTLWPGRCEAVSEDPLVVLDGAQNIASMKALKAALGENFPYRRLILVLGVSKDKDIAGICREVSGAADEVITTQSKNPRAYPAKKLAAYFRGKKAVPVTGVREAAKLALRIAQKDDLIVFTGSLFVVGEAREFFKRGING